MSPQEQQSHLLRQQEQVKTIRYCERNAATTFAGLVVCVSASAFVQPLLWLPTVVLLLAGLAFYIGWRADAKGHQLAGGVVIAAAVVVAAMACWLFGLRGSMMWAQGVGIMFAAFYGSIVFHQAVGAPNSGDKQ